MTYIERTITDVLKKRVATSKCTLVTGARQVGKSTFMRKEYLREKLIALPIEYI